MVGVEWDDDSTATQNTPQTIAVGSYDATEGIIIWLLLEGGANKTTIANGWITISGCNVLNDLTSICVDYWKNRGLPQTINLDLIQPLLLNLNLMDNLSAGMIDGC